MSAAEAEREGRKSYEGGRTGRRFQTRRQHPDRRINEARSMLTAGHFTDHDPAFLGNAVVRAVAANA